MEENIIIAGKNKMLSSVLLIDAHPLMRRAVRQLFDESDDFIVIAEVDSCIEGIDLALREKPDVIILDFNTKGLSGLDTVNVLRQENVSSRIVIFSGSDAYNDIFGAIDAGVDGYLLKDTDPFIFLEQIRDVVSGNIVYSNAVEEIISKRHINSNLVQGLTARELDVLSLVAKGLSNKQIANELFISEETVKVHIRNLLRKLNVYSRLAAAIVYLEYIGKK